MNERRPRLSQSTHQRTHRLRAKRLLVTERQCNHAAALRRNGGGRSTHARPFEPEPRACCAPLLCSVQFLEAGHQPRDDGDTGSLGSTDRRSSCRSSGRTDGVARPAAEGGKDSGTACSLWPGCVRVQQRHSSTQKLLFAMPCRPHDRPSAHSAASFQLSGADGAPVRRRRPQSGNVKPLNPARAASGARDSRSQILLGTTVVDCRSSCPRPCWPPHTASCML